MNIIDKGAEEMGRAMRRVRDAQARLKQAKKGANDARSIQVSAECELTNAQNELGKLLREADIIGGDWELGIKKRATEEHAKAVLETAKFHAGDKTA